jgi:hypothetical protein
MYLSFKHVFFTCLFSKQKDILRQRSFSNSPKVFEDQGANEGPCDGHPGLQFLKMI